MAGALEPNQLLAQQQAMRNVGLKRAKKMKPDKKRDKKFAILTIAVIVLICGVFATVPFWGDVLLWLLD
ncbi:MAG: hypothetical protein PUB32_02260 [Clostridiales bacterium]|nr:hypothetical protein [Clostridiales bacterium]